MKSEKAFKNKYEEVEYIKTTPSHRRDGLARLEKSLKDELEYLRTLPSHPRDRLARLFIYLFICTLFIVENH